VQVFWRHATNAPLPSQPAGDSAGVGMAGDDSNEETDEFDQYRKRMMLAYRFRPNPLNNPRRDYY